MYWEDTLIWPFNKLSSSPLLDEPLRTPKLLGFFSCNKTSESDVRIQLDASNCLYATWKYSNKHYRLDKDLLTYHGSRHCDENKVIMLKIFGYLRCLITQERFFRSSQYKLFDAEIICHIRILLKLIDAHADPHEKFTFLCTKFLGNIYISQPIGKKKPSCKAERTVFKTVVKSALFADKPDPYAANTKDPFMNRFHGAFKWSFGDSTVMYFSGISGVENVTEITAESPLNRIKVAVVKINSSQPNALTQNSRKIPRWYCHAFLTTSQNIHFVNTDSKTIEAIKTIELDDIRAANEVKWERTLQERFSFVAMFLNQLRNRLTSTNCPYTVFELRLDEDYYSHIQCRVHKGFNRYSFLPQEFINEMSNF
ncbi:hypothetical protein Bhyg_12981 [Pseudolycoriella hygida]|uniref:RAI1-like domain-containing protein n=1 Tax=Pseudolycoriella hygida TaxID=35572 RepID=A0A9Q0S1C5_9DIPT|nr:hypothetical protein Bhyg_12981 [Pseudolycoriella hygida]